ncbi:hypothetical protein D3C75_864210 [compost metagenome]
MKIEFADQESQYLLNAIELRLKEIGKTNHVDNQMELDISALCRMAEQLGVRFGLKQEGETHVVVKGE